MQKCLLTSILVVVCLLFVSETSWASEPDRDHFAVEERSDRLVISHAGQPVAEFVFRDDRIRRPYFANVHVPSGLCVTRHHPPIGDVDATDHDTMHPGIWLGFGNLSGNDFWRNEGHIEHVRFNAAPKVSKDRLTFTTESRLLSTDDKLLCELVSQFTLATRPAGWLLVWDATFHSDDSDFTFGDQEEMGFGARVATPLIETNGGEVMNSRGVTTARATWGQAAEWCDYSGKVAGRRVGITLLVGPNNFRESWWHNRDYGLMVANPFGRAAMMQGERSTVTVKRGELFRLTFAALLHSTTDYDPAAAYVDCEPILK